MPANKMKLEHYLLSMDGQIKGAGRLAGYRAWFEDYSNTTKAELEDRHRVLRDNKKFLLDKLGKQDFTAQDSACRRLYCWRVSCAQGFIYIFTAPERGTSIDVQLGNSTEHDFVAELKSQLRCIFELTTL